MGIVPGAEAAVPKEAVFATPTGVGANEPNGVGTITPDELETFDCESSTLPVLARISSGDKSW